MNLFVKKLAVLCCLGLFVSTCALGSTLHNSPFLKLKAAFGRCAKGQSSGNQQLFKDAEKYFSELYNFGSQESGFPFQGTLNQFAVQYADQILHNNGKVDDVLSKAFEELNVELEAVMHVVDRSQGTTKLPSDIDVEHVCMALSGYFYGSMLWRGTKRVTIVALKTVMWMTIVAGVVAGGAVCWNWDELKKMDKWK